MIASASVVLPLLMAAVLMASGVAKLIRPDDAAGWEELGVPAWLRRPWLMRAHPWGEIVLGVALALLGGALGLLAAAAAVGLMAAYLFLVVRAFRRPDETSCACFGSRAPITSATVVRNLWLTLLAAAVAAVIWRNPLLGGSVGGLVGAGGWAAVAAAAVAAVTALVIAWPARVPDREADDTGSRGASGPGAAEGADGDDYVRVRVPAVPVMFADGTEVNLRELASRRPLLLLAVSPVCGACTPVVESVHRWRELLPEIDVRLLLTIEPAKDRYTERSEPQSLHDVHDYVRESIGEWGTPTALLLGIDGLVAGGPVSGIHAIESFMGEIRSSLDEILAAQPSAERS